MSGLGVRRPVPSIVLDNGQEPHQWSQPCTVHVRDTDKSFWALRFVVIIHPPSQGSSHGEPDPFLPPLR